MLGQPLMPYDDTPAVHVGNAALEAEQGLTEVYLDCGKEVAASAGEVVGGVLLEHEVYVAGV
jgi:hypothetical protein